MALDQNQFAIQRPTSHIGIALSGPNPARNQRISDPAIELQYARHQGINQVKAFRVPHGIGDPKSGFTRLAGSQELTWTTQFEILLGDQEAIIRDFESTFLDH